MFSQNAEEHFILSYFGSHVGRFCSIGENDGQTLSNVRQLVLNGWNGICIEPAPTAYAKLYELYKDNRKVNTYPFVIGDTNGTVPFFESGSLLSATDTALVSSVHAHETERFSRTVSYTSIQAKSFRWKTFINRIRNKKFDFFSIDTEGNDLMIAQQIDFTDTKCVCIEWNGHYHLKDQFDLLFNPQGFKVIYTSGENLIYAK